MKIKFQSVKNLPWEKYGKFAQKAVKYTALSLVSTVALYKCSKDCNDHTKEIEQVRRLIKVTDINRYNRINEQIATGEKKDFLSSWLVEFEAMKDSIRATERAYFEGSQKAKNNLKNTK